MTGEPAPLVAVTGATGFVGRHLVSGLKRRGYRVRLLLRRPVAGLPEADHAVIGDIARPLNLASALQGVDHVVHSAGLAHAMSGLPADDYRTINTDATVALAKAARRAGVKRFVFLSSIRAQTGPVAEGIVDETRPPEPTDAYGRSKLEAEQGLAEIDLDWVALRPVVVYGPGAAGNVASLVRLASLPWPLPLGGIGGRRSLVSVESLTDAVAFVLAHPARLGRPLLVAEPEPLRLWEMIAALREGAGRRPLLVPMPGAALSLAASLLGRAEAYRRVAGDLVADAKGLRALGWTAPQGAAQGLALLGRSIASGRSGSQAIS